jgi:hypothetical protein
MHPSKAQKTMMFNWKKTLLAAMSPKIVAIVPTYVATDKKMARPKGFEPLTPRFVVWCSIQLSYGRASGRRCSPARRSPKTDCWGLQADLVKKAANTKFASPRTPHTQSDAQMTLQSLERMNVRCRSVGTNCA